MILSDTEAKCAGRSGSYLAKRGAYAAKNHFVPRKSGSYAGKCGSPN